MTLSILSFGICVASVAPSGTIDPPIGEVDSNALELGHDEWITVTFKNSAGAAITDVASIFNTSPLRPRTYPTRTQIDPLTASWEIYSPDNLAVPRASGTITGSVDSNAIYSPYSTIDPIYLYT